jgi:RNA polymerase sigma-70 factor, ECF subfamily
MTRPEPKEQPGWSSGSRWDEELCERLVAGDEAALRELYDEFSPLVYGLAARVTP